MLGACFTADVRFFAIEQTIYKVIFDPSLNPGCHVTGYFPVRAPNARSRDLWLNE